MAVMPAAMPPVVPMMMPVRLGGELPRIFLNRAGSARIDQRNRLRTLNRSRRGQKGANSRHAQNFRSVHISLLKFFSDARLRRTADLAATHPNVRASDVNVN
jgi:hypothetical protein